MVLRTLSCLALWLLSNLLSTPAHAKVLCLKEISAHSGIEEQLERWLDPIDVVIAPTCRGVAFIGRFERQGSRTVFITKRDTGSIAARVIPWLEHGGDDPLMRLAKAERLSEFSILVQGLLLELEHPLQVTQAKPSQKAPRPVIEKQPRPRRRPLNDMGLSVDLAGRYRAQRLLALQVGGGLRWRSLFLQIGYQLPARWWFMGRPIEVEALSLEGGWRPFTWGRRRWRLDIWGALRAEHHWVRRDDIKDPESHRFWDLGLLLGASGTRRLGEHLGLGARLGVGWYPAGNVIEIPGGPSARLNRVEVLLALFFLWSGGGR